MLHKLDPSDDDVDLAALSEDEDDPRVQAEKARVTEWRRANLAVADKDFAFYS